MIPRPFALAALGCLVVSSALAASTVTTAPIGFHAAPYPPSLTASVRFEEPSGNRALDALEDGALVVEFDNAGRGDAYDVEIRVAWAEGGRGVEVPKRTRVGTVAAGATREVRVPVKATEDVPDQAARLKLEFPEASGFDADPVTVAFDVRAFAPPKLVVADFGIDDASGNGRVEPGELVEVTVRVQNVGAGDAVGVGARIDLGSNVFLGAGSQPRHDLGNLLAGAYKDLQFSFYTNKRIRSGQPVPIAIGLEESRGRFEATEDLKIVANAPQRRSREVVVESVARTGGAQIERVGGLSVDVDREIPAGRAKNPDAVAVVIGNKNYRRGKVPAAEYADRDAAVMRQYLIETLGYDPDNILFVADATLSDFNQLFGTRRQPRGKLHDYVRPGKSDVFVYYAGHGAPDPDSHSAYFVPSDADPDYIGSSGYPLDLFWENLARVPARNLTVVLDTCFSGNSEKGLLLTNVSPALLKVDAELAGPEGAVVMTAAGTDQVASWYPEKKHSLFTYWWLKGLSGAADTDADRQISVGELEAYVAEHVPYWARRLSHKKQTPVVHGAADRVLARLR